MGKFRKNNDTFVLTGIILSIVLIGVATTFSFLMVDIPSDNSNKENMIVKTADNLELVYTDCVDTNDCSDITKDLGLGESVTKTFQIKNDTKVDSEYTIYFKELQSTFKNDELVYKIENIDTGDTLVDTTSVPYHRFLVVDIPIKENIKIEKNTIHNYRMTVTFLKKDYNQNENKDAMYSMKISIVPKGNPNFALAANTDEGIFKMEDDSGKPSYYYRGAVENNYVKFGMDKDGNDMYWRIIRFNGDGSMRMQYDGKANGHSDTDFMYTRGFVLTDQPWNMQNLDAKYIGWMFGGAQGEASTSKAQAQTNETSSDIKTAVDTWYKENVFDTGYHDYIADEIFCNDRSTPGEEVTGYLGDTGLGYAQNKTGYGPLSRVGWSVITTHDIPNPIFTCPQENDKFTVSVASGGNGDLTYPVGLITVDEIIAAGSGKASSVINKDYYLYKESFSYWSMSPGLSQNNATNFNNDYTGALVFQNVRDSKTNAAIPVINISSRYAEKMVGDGTVVDPYRLIN